MNIYSILNWVGACNEQKYCQLYKLRMLGLCTRLVMPNLTKTPRVVQRVSLCRVLIRISKRNSSHWRTQNYYLPPLLGLCLCFLMDQCTTSVGCPEKPLCSGKKTTSKNPIELLKILLIEHTLSLPGMCLEHKKGSEDSGYC